MTLAERYDAIICDLDGVVYRGPTAVPGAVEALEMCGLPVLYATNNASRTPAEVAAHLRDLGLTCPDEAVVTSSQAGAWVLSQQLDHGAAVLAVGGPGVAAAVAEYGLRPVQPDDAAGVDVAAVLQGYGPHVRAQDLAEAAYAIQRGARWVATNTDATLPTDRGIAPGNGSLVGAVRLAVGRDPDEVAGKPHPPLYLLSLARLGVAPERVLAVGDRLETDIAGAVATGIDSLLVLTGVSSRRGAESADESQRPTYIAADLRSLTTGMPGA